MPTKKERDKKKIEKNVENDVKNGNLDEGLNDFLSGKVGGTAMVDLIMSIKYPEVKNSESGGRKIKKNKIISY